MLYDMESFMRITSSQLYKVYEPTLLSIHNFKIPISQKAVTLEIGEECDNKTDETDESDKNKENNERQSTHDVDSFTADEREDYESQSQSQSELVQLYGEHPGLYHAILDDLPVSLQLKIKIYQSSLKIMSIPQILEVFEAEPVFSYCIKHFLRNSDICVVRLNRTTESTGFILGLFLSDSTPYLIKSNTPIFNEFLNFLIDHNIHLRSVEILSDIYNDDLGDEKHTLRIQNVHHSYFNVDQIIRIYPKLIPVIRQTEFGLGLLKVDPYTIPIIMTSGLSACLTKIYIHLSELRLFCYGRFRYNLSKLSTIELLVIKMKSLNDLGTLLSELICFAVTKSCIFNKLQNVKRIWFMFDGPQAVNARCLCELAETFHLFTEITRISIRLYVPNHFRINVRKMKTKYRSLLVCLPYNKNTPDPSFSDDILLRDKVRDLYLFSHLYSA